MDELVEWLDERKQRFIRMADQIWAQPQVALQETFACQLQIDDLMADGFRITRNVGGMPTAFVAEWGQGDPIIGFLGEYDALPELSQHNQPTQAPIVSRGPGHGCGHNLLGTASLAAASALKAWLAASGRAGTVRYYGCPAEETLLGKTYMARDGVFDNLDAAITWHPGGGTGVMRSTTLAMDNLKFRFFGRAAHAGVSPEAGRSALDAVELMNAGVNFLREHVPSTVRMHYVITNGGSAPNIVPAEAEVWYFVRAPQRHEVESVTARVRQIAQGAALMTGTRVEEAYLSGCYNMLPNATLIDVADAVLHDLAPLTFTAAEQAYAQQIIDGYSAEIREQVLTTGHVPPGWWDRPLCGDIMPARPMGELMPGSSEVGDVSWIAPTVWVSAATWALGVPGHSWGVTATGAMSIGHKGMLHAAQAMAGIATRLVVEPDRLAQARAEFAAATAGRPYTSPLPPGQPPPLP
ncbi:MAG: amidohydrolase [Chloroflexi bacterium]|nr:amidohydrolase [Chloroflexota bacterium]